jgi:hypothetical protein
MQIYHSFAARGVMSEMAVREILDRIDNLSESDRALLERELSERLESNWLKEAAAAREEALRRGLDDDAIDRTVEELRYPRRAGQ